MDLFKRFASRDKAWCLKEDLFILTTVHDLHVSKASIRIPSLPQRLYIEVGSHIGHAYYCHLCKAIGA